MLKGLGPWLIIVNGKWEKVENITKASEILFYKFYISTNYKYQIRNSKQYGKIFINIINKIFFRFFVK